MKPKKPTEEAFNFACYDMRENALRACTNAKNNAREARFNRDEESAGYWRDKERAFREIARRLERMKL